ncbi:MAG: hypothetical protein ACQKHC_02155 [Candidatus Phytoplasma pruni]
MSRKRSYRKSFRRNKLTLGSFCMYWAFTCFRCCYSCCYFFSS